MQESKAPLALVRRGTIKSWKTGSGNDVAFVLSEASKSLEIKGPGPPPPSFLACLYNQLFHLGGCPHSGGASYEHPNYVLDGSSISGWRLEDVVPFLLLTLSRRITHQE